VPNNVLSVMLIREVLFDALSSRRLSAGAYWMLISRKISGSKKDKLARVGYVLGKGECVFTRRPIELDDERRGIAARRPTPCTRGSPRSASRPSSRPARPDTSANIHA